MPQGYQVPGHLSSDRGRHFSPCASHRGSQTVLEMPGRCVDCILPACNLVAWLYMCAAVSVRGVEAPSAASQRLRACIWSGECIWWRDCIWHSERRISAAASLPLRGLGAPRRRGRTTTLHGDATEFYYRPSDPQLPQRTASRYPIPRADAARDGARAARGSPPPSWDVAGPGRTHPDGFS